MGATPWTTTSSASPAMSAGATSRPAETLQLINLPLPVPGTKKGVLPLGCAPWLTLSACCTSKLLQNWVFITKMSPGP